MAAGRVIIDTGPLVAFLDSDDHHHDWAGQTLPSLRAPLLTCEAVLSEACFLLRHAPGACDRVMQLVETSAVEVVQLFPTETAAIRTIMQRYSDRKIDLADACLVRLSGMFDECRILTIDRADFSVYRRNRRQSIPLICP